MTGCGAIRVEGPPAPLLPTEHAPPVDALTDEFPIRLTTGRRLDSFNTGVQTGGYTSPLRRGEALELHPDDASGWNGGGGRSRAHRLAPRSDRGAGALRRGPAARAGLHDAPLPRRGRTNILTIDAVDPKSGTAEFKASAIRVEKIAPGEAAARESELVDIGVR
jgi:anaerobic selenocysteine-containing dehydrogenase